MQKIKKGQQTPALRTFIISDKANLYSNQSSLERLEWDRHATVLHRVKQDIHTSMYWTLLPVRPICWKHSFIHSFMYTLKVCCTSGTRWGMVDSTTSPVTLGLHAWSLWLEADIKQPQVYTKKTTVAMKEKSRMLWKYITVRSDLTWRAGESFQRKGYLSWGVQDEVTRWAGHLGQREWGQV